LRIPRPAESVKKGEAKNGGVVGDGQGSEDLDLVAEGGLVDGAGLLRARAHGIFSSLP